MPLHHICKAVSVFSPVLSIPSHQQIMCRRCLFRLF